MGFFDFMKDNKENRNEDVNQDIKEENVEESKENYSPTSEEKKQKVAKRIIDMSEKLDNLSTQVYHLQQRVELLEKKLRVNPEGE
ncbi:hypothetical protein COU59_02930 [Candidatus Pacearchaeota archaeon CG10_big_fil_rev_8_21_14_0_10_34_12]|nr:MAG: hypothetical protein COU59_02930 [Candidatus Pacearchaeota archaeon CG10_big_fil_rev_8_21_14_0_10_34_12]